MARRSGRKTNPVEHYDPVLPIRDNSTQIPKKNKRAERNLLTPSNALQTTSPILNEDVQSLFASTVHNWSSLTEDKQRRLIDTFPLAYRVHNEDEGGKLKCPITEEFVANDNIIKRDVARFKRDVEAGFYVKKWQDEGKKAMKERAEGQFDDYIKQHAESNFGQMKENREDEVLNINVGKNSESDGVGQRG